MAEGSGAAQLLEDGLQFGRQWGLNLHLFARGGVGEVQARCVEKVTLSEQPLVTVPVDRVSQARCTRTWWVRPV
jgi:hypothetical protein